MCPGSIGQRHRLYEGGRVGSVDNGVFIHAIVPRHVETVVKMSQSHIDYSIQ